MRYSFEAPPFEGDYVEYSDMWSRGQVRAAWAAVDREREGGPSEAALLEVLRPKILALHLSCGDGQPPITDPADLTPERTDQIDIRIYPWFAGTWIKHLGELGNLGNANGRTLFVISDLQMTPAQTSQNHLSITG